MFGNGDALSRLSNGYCGNDVGDLQDGQKKSH